MDDDLDGFDLLDDGTDDEASITEPEKKQEPRMAVPVPTKAPVNDPDDDLLGFGDDSLSNVSPIIENTTVSSMKNTSNTGVTNDEIADIESAFADLNAPDTHQQHTPAPKVPDLDMQPPRTVQSPSYETIPEHVQQQRNVREPIVTQQVKPSRSFVPDPISIDLIKKIILILKAYRALDENMQQTVAGFLEALRQSRSDNRKIDGEADIIKDVIEIDPHIRDAVHDFITAYGKTGADRAFFLMSLNARQLNDLADIIGMSLKDSGVTRQPARNDTLESIRDAAQILEKLIEDFPQSSMSFIYPIDKILQVSLEIMQS